MQYLEPLIEKRLEEERRIASGDRSFISTELLATRFGGNVVSATARVLRDDVAEELSARMEEDGKQSGEAGAAGASAAARYESVGLAVERRVFEEEAVFLFTPHTVHSLA